MLLPFRKHKEADSALTLARSILKKEFAVIDHSFDTKRNEQQPDNSHEMLTAYKEQTRHTNVPKKF